MSNYKKNKNNRNWNNQLQLGDHSYYSCFSDSPARVKALVNTTKEALSPYYNFLDEAIKAEEKRGSYQVDWKLIESNFSLLVIPIYSKFKIEKPKTIFKVSVENMKSIKETRNKLFFDNQDETIRFNKEDIVIKDNWITLSTDTLPLDDEILELNNAEVAYKIENLSLKENDSIKSLNKTFKIEKIEDLDDGWNVYIKTTKNLKNVSFDNQTLNISKYTYTFENLFDGESEFQYEKMANEYQCKKLPNNSILKDENNIEYSWKEQKNSKTSDIVIQLIDDDSNDNNKPVSEYFFEDNVTTIYQGSDRKNSFEIKTKKVDDKILILRQDWKNPKQLKKNEDIKIKVDTGNLKKQRDTIKLLNNSPVKAQENLIKLFERKNDRLWNYSKKVEIDDWYILNNENYDGTLDQREFVNKAIATEDFAILEGPPGSGKTTTILELILQLIKQGKKILLSASTHVAIDNVLERIDKYDIDKMVEPLRVGRVNSVGESIKHLQIDEKIETYIKNGFNKEMAEKIVLDSANLVCGTTMGINQFPPIKDRNFKSGTRVSSDLPMDTIFDYMIIDESSKTTFQEFLVPAMLAKKWILVGDIKQLSPFIEQSHIVHNFNVAVPQDVQKATRIVFETLYKNPNPYIVEVSSNEEKEIKKYLDAWGKKEDNPYGDKIVSYSDEKDLFTRLGSDLILVKDGNWNNVKKYMPKTHIAILKKDRDSDDFLFKQNYLNKNNKLKRFNKINQKSSKDNAPIEYKDFFKSMLKKQNWAEEITWRMIRVYERRMLKNPNSYYEKTYELLKPVGKDNAVDRIYNMTLPSILESIQVGNGENHRNSTTITEGFDTRDLRQRHETLKTQHRMHPDISKFSREEFYTEYGVKALQNSTRTDREWNYNEYDNRAVWIDVKKKDKDNGRNFEEVKVVMEEIKKFLKFTKSNPKNKDAEPWSIAVLTFHQAQATILRDGLRKLTSQPTKISKFHIKDVEILLYTVDKFQGMEADIVFISMMKTQSIGFLDNINRLNVALTRAKYQRVIVGDRNFFANRQNASQELKRLAKNGGM